MSSPETLPFATALPDWVGQAAVVVSATVFVLWIVAVLACAKSDTDRC